MKIKRLQYKKIAKHLSEREITLITGPRQAGKTTILKELEKEVAKREERSIFLNLDIESDYDLFQSQNKFLFALRNLVGDRKAYVFIDEFQRKVNGGKFLKGIYDMDLPYKFIVTGSGSIELKEEIHESLAGRKRVFELGTLTFKEYLDYKTDYTYKSNISAMFKIYPEQVNLHLLDYLTFGGYPKVTLADSAEEKTKILEEIYSSYLIKDITALLNVEKTSKFRKLVENLSILDGKLVNLTQLSSNTGVSIPTIEKYLWYLENTYAITASTPFSKSSLKEINRAYIYYFNDLGLKNLVSNNLDNPVSRIDLGFDFQTYIFQELKQMLQHKKPINLHFWRSKNSAEVDIVIKKADSIVGVECKYAHYEKPKYTRSMYSFIEKYKPKDFFIVNKNFTATDKIDSTTITFLPFADLEKIAQLPLL